MEALIDVLKKLRRLADQRSGLFASEGWRAFFAILQKELSDDFFAKAQYHLGQLKFRNGVLLSARLGKGNKGMPYLLRQQPDLGGWFTRLFAPRQRVFSFSLNPRDENGFKALAEIKDQGIARVANAVAQSADHVRNYFRMLRSELAFYMGCLNLHERLVEKGERVCFPMPVATDERSLSFRGLYDVCLSLNLDHKVVGNDVDADKKQLLIITGANQGGKSTFLRSVGLAQVMMQSGMFVAAESFCSSLCDGLFTHYKREEDIGLKSGKLDEELARMSAIVDHVTSRAMILFNESFAATNEREGSEIARQIVTALLEQNARMVFVTHLYELARGFYNENWGDVLFLRAERQSGGTRTFKLVEGAPLETSFGEDLYRNIFVGEAARAETAAGACCPSSRCRALGLHELSDDADFPDERRGR
ncbi:MAG: MutS-related protein [Beijerinckiaceae bacterium]